MKILVVEDEKDIQDLMLLHLKRESYETASVENGEDALKALTSENYDLVVLDWMLPGLSGLDLCKKMRADPKSPMAQVPVLMVTARAETADIVLGLEAGADDYITKPFDIPVFIARVRALLRRALQKDHDTGVYQIDTLKVDTVSYKVYCAEQEVHLTPSEFKLLAALAQNHGRVLSRERLIDLVQGEGIAVVDRTIDTHIFGLRKKLGSCSDIVETIRGVGYRIKA